MKNTEQRFLQCDECKTSTVMKPKGVYYRGEDLWLCLSCGDKKEAVEKIPTRLF
jgi:hypothetical protein